MIKQGWAVLSHCKRIYVNIIMRTRGNETAENSNHIYFSARLSPQRSRTALISHFSKLNAHLLICSAAEPQTQLYNPPPPHPPAKTTKTTTKREKKRKRKRNVHIHFNPNCLLLTSLLFLLPFHDASTHSSFSVLNELL